MSDGGKGRQKSDNLRTDDSVAEKRMKSGKSDPSLNSDKGKRTDEIVSHKLGIGGKDTYRKEKYIVENQKSLTTEDFADWDEGKLSTNKENEDKGIKDLIESNLRQRVVGNANPIKLGKCFQFLNDWYGFEHGGDRKSSDKICRLKENGQPQN